MGPFGRGTISSYSRLGSGRSKSVMTTVIGQISGERKSFKDQGTLCLFVEACVRGAVSERRRSRSERGAFERLGIRFHDFGVYPEHFSLRIACPLALQFEVRIESARGGVAFRYPCVTNIARFQCRAVAAVAEVTPHLHDSFHFRRIETFPNGSHDVSVGMIHPLTDAVVAARIAKPSRESRYARNVKQPFRWTRRDRATVDHFKLGTEQRHGKGHRLPCFARAEPNDIVTTSTP